MDWLVFPLRDLLVWSFENLLEPAGNIINYLWVVLVCVGIVVWLKYQAKFNEEAASNPNQIK